MKDFLKKNRNPHDLADQFDLSLSKAKQIVSEQTEEILGWGRPNLQRYIISRKLNWQAWPAEHYSRLRHFQLLHDQGKVTMCQGRDGSFTIQYAIPTKRQVSRTPYFTEKFLC